MLVLVLSFVDESLICIVQGGNAALIKKQVQVQFHRNSTETDPTKVTERLLSLAADS